MQGQPFYRIIDQFIDQSGAWTESIYGGQFKDDPGGLALRHDRPGLLSMANTGPDTNGSHFSIVVSPARHLDGKYTIFGEVCSISCAACTASALTCNSTCASMHCSARRNV
jgi:peptidyl-prolyl isomerase D